MNFIYFILSFLLFGCDKKDVNWKKNETYSYVLKQSINKKIDLSNKRFIPNFRFKENGEIAKGYFYNSKANMLSNKRWEIKIPTLNRVHVYECGSYIVLGDLSTTFHILNKNTGKILHKGDLQGPLCYAFYSNNKLVIGNTTGDIKCFDTNFELMWHRKKNSSMGLKQSALLVGENIINLTSDGDISSINVINGEENWSHITSQKVDSHDLYANDKLVILRVNHNLIIINDSGKVIYDKYVDNLNRVLFDSEKFLYLILSEKVLVADLQGILKKEFYNSYDSTDNLFFVFKKSLFSLSRNGNLSVYHNQKESIYNFNKMFDYIDDENCAISSTKSVYFI